MKVIACITLALCMLAVRGDATPDFFAAMNGVAAAQVAPATGGLRDPQSCNTGSQALGKACTNDSKCVSDRDTCIKGLKTTLGDCGGFESWCKDQSDGQWCSGKANGNYWVACTDKNACTTADVKAVVCPQCNSWSASCQKGGGGGSGSGAIIGVVVGVLVVAGAGFYYVKVYKKRDGAGYTEQP